MTAHLLPDLPPELRNLIYSHAISEANPPTNAGLPFQSKCYDSSHTTITIVPIHHGNANLLALAKHDFQEAKEYHTWLLTSALTLRIAIIFKGHANTFIQSHWNKKISSHLKNLVKKYPWVKKVVHYEVQILWEPKCWEKVGKKVSIGGIAGNMVKTLMGVMDGDLMRKRGCLRAVLNVVDFVAMGYKREGRCLGLGEFFECEIKGVKKVVREVRIAPRGNEVNTNFTSYLKPLPKVGKEREGLVDEKGVVEWGDWTKGGLILEKEVELGKGIVKGKAGAFPDDSLSIPYSVFSSLLEECLETEPGY